MRFTLKLNKYSKNILIGFSLIELSVVIFIISIMGVFVYPLVSNTSKQSTALSELKSTIEMARSLAIKNAIMSFVVFFDDEEYGRAYSLYSIFLLDPKIKEKDSYDFKEIMELPVVRYKDWKKLPNGVIFALGSEYKSFDGRKINTILDMDIDKRKFFSFGGSSSKSKDGSKFHFFAFNKDGFLSHPSSDLSEYSNIGLIRGYFDKKEKKRFLFGNNENGELGNGGNNRDYLSADLLHVNIYSGRVRQAN